ncbi:hypothetical protein EIP86_000202 [Pleurotus ostreatoroseus]|nr:hypothetical protein EIP86_000202 [Pleurotus ostreatoroseus]
MNLPAFPAAGRPSQQSRHGHWCEYWHRSGGVKDFYDHASEAAHRGLSEEKDEATVAETDQIRSDRTGDRIPWHCIGCLRPRKIVSIIKYAESLKEEPLDILVANAGLAAR